MMPHSGMGTGSPYSQQQQQQQSQQQQFPPMVGGGGMQQSGAGSGGAGPGPGFTYASQERSQRSVFVGNIPYEATEEDLKELFSQVGPVVGFRLVQDRETGKSKGYGFCEYSDQETAASALRNLNGFEFHGRNLRIDTAAGGGKEELRQLQASLGAPQEESPYGPSVDPPKAPEAIGRAVASLPPEQMFELMKQMKLCIQTNPNEARNMLLQNPQLAYALLQAQVVMRIVDPQVAMTMLHRDTEPVPPVMPQGMLPPVGSNAPIVTGPAGAMPQAQQASMMGMARSVAGGAGDIDYRTGFAASSAGGGRGFMGMPASSGYMPGPPQTQPSTRPGFGPTPSILDRSQVPPAAAPRPSLAPPSSSSAAGAAGSEDQEKAALIMQVLQLTDEQISMLPPDQKQSVLLLREQLRSSQR